MNKILVMGVSSGVGKSTFARKVGDILQVPVCHLDQLFWKPGWAETPASEFAAAQEQFMAAHERWIVDGNYSGTSAVRFNQADTLIYLELPLYICYFRVLKRWLRFRGKTRTDMGRDCPEKIDWAFLSFIGRTYYPRKRKIEERLRAFECLRSENKAYHLKGKHAMKRFVNELQNETGHEL